jgi:hypothetical protein
MWQKSLDFPDMPSPVGAIGRAKFGENFRDFHSWQRSATLAEQNKKLQSQLDHVLDVYHNVLLSSRLSSHAARAAAGLHRFAMSGCVANATGEARVAVSQVQGSL